MFAEQRSDAKTSAAQWLEGLARRHPRIFDAALVILAVGLTVHLLLKTGYSFVLYQGF